ncbi:chemoreceptor glutamine deamidase CheD [Vogesella sp. DC21W]|uniref:Probable chemoreceptor glutamine deamidase CheD n=1 Tax=Vogesella aquatica TaxID=2984206 RepID=A0ABT5IXE5_9NEIS|nr:chemoreceptor glutamine deamidase CheD [Vogesella aquatica]MDC7717237.1 chemoreceptor glutamine deamidase CheD [Vogesella aquatica]
MSIAGTAHHRYFDKSFNRAAAKLLPGEYEASADGLLLVTVLGSCVSACLRDRKTGIAGMNHFMLPDQGSSNSDRLMPARFGTHAMELLINDMLKLGANRSTLEAKVFGGGNVIAGMTTVNVGQRNAGFVRAFLAQENIPIVAEDLGLDIARKIYFFTDTGKVMVKKINPQQTLVQEEESYRRRIDRDTEQKQGGDIDLFI